MYWPQSNVSMGTTDRQETGLVQQHPTTAAEENKETEIEDKTTYQL